MRVALLTIGAAALLAAAGLGLSGCVAEGGYDTGVYYGPQPEPWFHDDVWLYGSPGWGWHEGHERHERWEHVHPRRW